MSRAPAPQNEPPLEPAPKKEFTALVHVGLRDQAYVVDYDGSRYDLPAGSARLSGKSVSVVADPDTFTAQPK